MYFSRVQLNPHRRSTKKLLASPRAMHGAIEASFPPSPSESELPRSLWRVDEDRHDIRLYVVSTREPQLTHIVEQAGWDSSPAETTDYGRFLDGLTIGQQYAFRVTVNPVKREFVAGKRGKLLPHLTEDQQLTWFLERADSWGFVPLPLRDEDTSSAPSELGPDDLSLRVTKRADRSFGRYDGERRRTVTQRQVTIDGSLEVTNAKLLRQYLVSGMGRGKAYGCGLMTLARGR